MLLPAGIRDDSKKQLPNPGGTHETRPPDGTMEMAGDIMQIGRRTGMWSRVYAKAILAAFLLLACTEQNQELASIRESTARLIESQLDSSNVFINEKNGLHIEKPHFNGAYCYHLWVEISDSVISITRSKNGIVFKNPSKKHSSALIWGCNPPLPSGATSARGDSYPVSDSSYTLSIKNQAVGDSIFHGLNRLKQSGPGRIRN